MNENLWRGLGPGTIVDDDIVRLAEGGELITSGFEPRFVKQACYELRASRIFYNLVSPSEDKRVEIDTDDFYLLKPNCFVVCVVAEHLCLPPNVLGRILAKGRLFSVGILPVNTHADPGFTGRLGITLFNASKRYIKLRPGEPIAKIEFSFLKKPVSRPYTGQHGYETEIWPVATSLLADPQNDEVRKRIGNAYMELKTSHGETVAEMYRRVQYYSKIVWVQIGVVLAAFTVLLALHKQVDLVTSLWIGIVANVMTMLVWNSVSSFRR